MLFDKPSERNPIDDGTFTGKPHTRIDGPLKVAGKATYAYEYTPSGEGAERVAYGFVLGSGIAHGRIASIDVTEARAAPGVLLVLTHDNAPKHKPKGKHAAPQ